MIRCLVQFRAIHEEFVLPEFESVLKVLNISAKYDTSSLSPENCFVEVYFESVEDARRVCERAILIKSIYHFWADAPTHEACIERVKDYVQKHGTQDHGGKWKFDVISFGNTARNTIQKINAYSFLDLKGDIDLKHPDITYCIIEKHGLTDKQLKHVYFGTLISHNTQDAAHKYDLKKRKYLGTTSFDAELSLVMANVALADSGKLIYDPFVGTGSFLISNSHYGAYTMGSDIDGLVMKGIVKLVRGTKGIQTIVEQYGLEKTVLGTVIMDNSLVAYRPVQLFDAIVADPPYGVRAGARKVGEGKSVLHAGAPMTVLYDMEEVVVDLIKFAVKFLKVGGRLVFWLPTVTGQFSTNDIPSHPCFRILYAPSQEFGKWERRMITMERVEPESNDEQSDNDLIRNTAAAHAGFRDKYFSSFDEERLKGN